MTDKPESRVLYRKCCGTQAHQRHTENCLNFPAAPGKPSHPPRVWPRGHISQEVFVSVPTGANPRRTIYHEAMTVAEAEALARDARASAFEYALNWLVTDFENAMSNEDFCRSYDQLRLRLTNRLNEAARKGDAKGGGE